MDLDWSALFSTEVPPLEMFLRGTFMYWFIFIALRLAGRRDVGSLGVADMLVLVLVADAAGNGMSGEYRSLTSGAVLVATLIGWTVAIDRLAYFCEPVGRWLTADRVCLIADGQLCRRNMRKEYISKDELMSELRQQGIDDIHVVRRAYIESDGNISVIKRG
jgi:uncharacterized membrane protein YcaP (DUF421 family)